jgi:hypothetical protein
MVCAMTSFENINSEMLKNGYRAMHAKWASSTWQTDIVNAAAKQKGEQEGGEDEWNSYCREEEPKQFTKTAIITNYFSK